MNLHDAKRHRSRSVEQALNGDEVVIARAGKALVRLVPVEDTPRTRSTSAFSRGKQCWMKT